MKNIEQVLRIIGLILMGIYVISATGIVPVPITIARTALFLLGPFAIIGITFLASKYKPHDDYKTFQQLGYVFIVIAFALFTAMLVVQYSGYYFYKENKEFIINAKEIFKMINSIQLGIDITFDIFYSLGMLMFSLSFLKLKRMGLLIGFVGIITSIGLLSFNMITFPLPPKNDGLIDLGPYTIIWWVLLIIYIDRNHKMNEKNTSV
ncbi:MAG: hypothetical protein GY931_13810 [Maribacter sp.]|nr:hypothetical protein [Maribacter sp.]